MGTAPGMRVPDQLRCAPRRRRRRPFSCVDALERRQLLSAAPGVGAANVAPSLELLADEYVPVGRPVTIQGLAFDDDSSRLAVTVDFGDGTAPATRTVNKVISPLFTVTHTYATRATYPLTVTVDDGAGGVTTEKRFVTATDLAGVVFEDANDNGVRDFREGAIAGATVFLDADGDAQPGAGEMTAATDDGGFYHFDGLAAGAYKVGYVPPAGWRVTNPDPSPPGTNVTATQGGQRSFGISYRAQIGGTVFYDVDGDGVHDASDPASSSNLAPYLDVNNDGFFDRGVDRRADLLLTAPGRYVFRSVEPGTYTVRLGPGVPINAEPTGPQVLSTQVTVTLPAGGSGNGAYVITVGPAEIVQGKDFGFAAPQSTVDGYLFEDADQDGARDAGEAGIRRGVVFLDADADGALDPDERRTFGGTDGFYRFFLPAGTFTVRQVLPTGWAQTLPAGGAGHSVIVDEGTTTRAHLDFGSYRIPSPEIVGRHVFYNNSFFDGNDPNANSADDDAIAPDKDFVTPFQAGRFGTLTSYTRGINGVMIDFAHLPAGVDALTADDFAFRLTDGRGGIGSAASSWSDAPAPASVTLRRGAGANGSDRVTLVWPDGAIRNTWLEVRVRYDRLSGLMGENVFYAGNLVGEVGDAFSPGRVSAMDVVSAFRAVSAPAAVTSRFDFNRDGRVNILDVAAARANINRSIRFAAEPVTPPPPAAPAAAPAASVRVWSEAPADLLR